MSTSFSGERRKYPRFSCACPIRISLSDFTEHVISGECLEVCRNGLRVLTSDAIPAPVEVSLRAQSLGLTGHGVVRYCRADGDHYIVGLEFAAGLRWLPPDQSVHRSTLSAGMGLQSAAIFEDLLGGIPARELQAAIDRLAESEREILFCTAACIHPAVAETCLQRAAEIAELLTANGQSLPATLTTV